MKHDPVNYFVAKHVTGSLTPRKFHNFAQSNDAHVLTGINLERRNLLCKYRGFSTYIEDEMKICFLRNDVFHCHFIRLH